MTLIHLHKDRGAGCHLLSSEICFLISATDRAFCSSNGESLWRGEKNLLNRKLFFLKLKARHVQRFGLKFHTDIIRSPPHWTRGGGGVAVPICTPGGWCTRSWVSLWFPFNHLSISLLCIQISPQKEPSIYLRFLTVHTRLCYCHAHVFSLYFLQLCHGHIHHSSIKMYAKHMFNPQRMITCLNLGPSWPFSRFHWLSCEVARQQQGQEFYFL